MFALYLLGKDVSYVLPTVSAEKICNDLPEIGIGKRAVNSLRNTPEFEETVKREFVDQIKDKENLKLMFYGYMKKLIEKNLKLANPSTKVLEVLGYLSEEYNPKVKIKEVPLMTLRQKARLIHAREQAEANRKKREEEDGQ